MITYDLTTRDHEARVKRFLETGAPPPEGATMLGRWITLGHNLGFMLAETDDPKTIFAWVSQWSDLIDFTVHPVLESTAVGEILAGAKR